MNLNGKKFDQGKTEWDLLPLGPVEEVVKVLMHGKEKYGRDNWQLVDNPIRRYYSAAQRHLSAFQRARFDTKNPFDAVDSESKLHHLAHAACCILFLLWHERKELCEEDAAGALLDRLMDGLAASTDTTETDAEFADELRTLRDLGIIQEITSQVKFASEDRDALDRLDVRDVPEIELKATKALAKGKDRFRVKGIRFVRVS